MNTSIIANVGTLAAMKALNKTNNRTYSGVGPIDIPGTVVGNLRNATETNKFREELQRYNNYKTDIFGSAQMAADRYMSLKERIPMQIEYYRTPTEKATITMYINPEKLTVSTQKVESKQITRGGIYYHIYGDDHWKLTLHGTCGYSQMRGIEALEEAYHYSGTLLKYQNVSQSTVHTNKLTSTAPTIMQTENKKDDSDQKLIEGMTKVFGAETAMKVADNLGMTNKDNNGDQTSSESANNNLFSKIVKGVMSNGSGFSLENLAAVSAQTIACDYFGLAEKVTGNPNNISGMIQGLTNLDELKSATSQILPALATDIICAATTGQKPAPILQTAANAMLNGTKSGLHDIITLLTGDPQYMKQSSKINESTMGHYYDMKQMSIDDLNNVVRSVQQTAKSFKSMYAKAGSNWSDIEDQFTDPYRPRMSIIYFDDRVYIGHFSNFSWTRQAETLLINYDLTFTVVRMVVLKRNEIPKQTQTSPNVWGTARDSLLSVAASWGIQQMLPKSKDK